VRALSQAHSKCMHQRQNGAKLVWCQVCRSRTSQQTSIRCCDNEPRPPVSRFRSTCSVASLRRHASPLSTNYSGARKRAPADRLRCSTPRDWSARTATPPDGRTPPVIVIDASILATALGDDGEDGANARARIRGEELAAPEIIDLEVASVWRRTLS